MSSPSRPLQENDSVRERILLAAEGRFRNYGYGKTTMAEIAADCDMSAANIYRFFEYKQGIAVALARRDLHEIEGSLAKVVQRTDCTSRERLKDFVLTNFRYLHRCWSELPRFHELVDDICAARPDIVVEHGQRKHALIVELLCAGKAAGEFYFDDVEALAETILMATKVSALPSCMGIFSLEEFEHRLPIVIDTLVDGFAASSNTR